MIKYTLPLRLRHIQSSQTLTLNAKTQELKKRGIDVISFAAGEPDFATPDFIKEEAVAAIATNFTRYTEVAGILPLREAIARRTAQECGIQYQPEEIVVCCGAKHALYNACQALFQEGDEVIIPTPYWVSYPPMVLFAGATPVFLETTAADNFKVTPARLSATITNKTRGIFVNSPSNPTGMIYSRTELSNLAEILLAYDIYIISDSIYSSIVYPPHQFFEIAALSPEIKDRTVLVNGVSKSFAMTGWRIGWAAARKEIIAAMIKMQAHSTSNPNSIAQKAATAGLLAPPEKVAYLPERFLLRRNLMLNCLKNVPFIKCFEPQGAFYLFIDVRELLTKRFGSTEIKTDDTLSELLLSHSTIGVVPGSAFGYDGFIRLSFALDEISIQKGMDRFKEFVAQCQS